VRTILREQIQLEVDAMAALVQDADAFDVIELMRLRELGVVTIGVADDKMRGAVPSANYHVRDRKSVRSDGTGATRQITYAGMTLEMTALTRVGKPTAIHTVAPVFVGIAIHYGTSGSPEGMADALEQAEANGLTGRPKGSRARWPFMTSDMAYNAKDGTADILLKHRYNFVGRFPEGWGIECPSTKPAGAPATEPEPGVLQWAGAFFCPAVLALIKGHRTPKMEQLLRNDQFRLHDKRLRRILPYLMGYNSRPFYAQSGHGRPGLGGSRKQVVKVKLVCPAAMGNVICPLKPESMKYGCHGVPVASRPGKPTNEDAAPSPASPLPSPPTSSNARNGIWSPGAGNTRCTSRQLAR
jgi:hypothetical protein